MLFGLHVVHRPESFFCHGDVELKFKVVLLLRSSDDTYLKDYTRVIQDDCFDLKDHDCCLKPDYECYFSNMYSSICYCYLTTFALLLCSWYAHKSSALVLPRSKGSRQEFRDQPHPTNA